MNATVFLIGEYVQNATQTDWNGNIKTYMPLELVEKSKEEYPNINFCSHTYGLHYHNSINKVHIAINTIIMFLFIFLPCFLWFTIIFTVKCNF